MTDEDLRVACPHCERRNATALGMRVTYRQWSTANAAIAQQPPHLVEHRYRCGHCGREFTVAEPADRA